MRRVILAAALVVLLAPSQSAAKDPVPGLQDLVGAKGGSAEGELERRGYTFVQKGAGDGGINFWRQNSSGKCISVHTDDGRYQAITWAKASNCPGSSGGDGGMKSIDCTFDGKNQKCKADILSSEAATQIDVHFPDGFTRTVIYDHGTFRNNGDGLEWKSKEDDGNYVVHNDNKETFKIPVKWLK